MSNHEGNSFDELSDYATVLEEDIKEFKAKEVEHLKEIERLEKYIEKQSSGKV